MALAVNASIVDPFVSGLGVYTLQVVKELCKLRDDLNIYTSYPNAFRSTNVKIENIFVNLGPSYGKKAHAIRLVWTQTVFPIRLLKNKISKLFSPIPEGVVGISIPQTVVVHDLIPLKFPHEYPFQHFYFRWYVAPLLRKAKWIITVSEQSKADLVSDLRIDPIRIQVVPGGCDHSVFYPQPSNVKIKKKYGLNRYLLYVGNLHPHKNLHGLIKAFSHVSSVVPHQLVVVGKKDKRFSPMLEALAVDLGLKDRVLFLDYIGTEDLRSLYAGADVFVLPSLYEGFGLPLVEAMACGIPVISGKMGATAETVGEAGILVNPDNVKELGESIGNVLSSSGLRQDLREKSLNRAQQFRWDRTAEIISEIIGDS